MSIARTDSKASFGLTPSNLEEAMKFAKLIADSDLAPKDYKGKPGNVLIAMQMGAEVGLKPMQAIQNIAVINGRPSIWGDALLAIIMSQPDFIDIKEWIEDGTAYCTITRRGRTPVTKHFSEDDAQKAGLLSKEGPWKTYKDRMKMFRARGFCGRDVYADALKGFSIAEEVLDIPQKNNIYVVSNQDERKSQLIEKLRSAEVDVEKEPQTLEENNLETIEDSYTAITLDDVKYNLESARTISELLEATDLARELKSEEDKEKAREIFSARKKVLDSQ